MGLWAFGKKKIKQHIRIKEWMHYDSLVESTLWVKDLIGRVYAIPTSKRHEDFETALARLHLTDKALLKRIQFFKHMIRLYIVACLAMVSYGHFYLYHATHSIWLLLATYSIALLLLAQAFRYSYWLCQIRLRKLGCSVVDWLLWLVRVYP